MTERRDYRDFWNRRTLDCFAQDGAAVEPAELGTVTSGRSIVRLRDQLEKAHLANILQLHREMTVLDLGGGAGRLALWLAPQVSHVTVVDSSQALLDAGRVASRKAEVSNVTFVHASALSFTTEKRFDLIVVAGLAAHLRDDEIPKLFDTCATLLRGGGRLVVKEPVSTDLTSRADERAGASGEVEYRALFRPRSVYEREGTRKLALLYHAPTCAHLIPWFAGGTNEAADRVSEGWASVALQVITPLWVSADPSLRQIERVVRGHHVMSRVLARVPVLQDFFVFAKPRTEALRAPDGPALSVVVIAFNEEECLERTVEDLVTTLRGRPLKSEVILVDDGSSDASPEIMQALVHRHPEVTARFMRENRGIGAALRSGFGAATGQYLSWIPADGQIKPQVIWDLYDRRLLGGIITTVYRTRNDHWLRTVVSNSLNALIWLRTGTPAKSGGNYLLSKELWDSHGPRDENSMMMSTALRHRAREAGETIVEVEIDCQERIAGRSKVLNTKAIGRTLRGLGQMGRR